jgi:hypothetical protein
VNIVVRDEDSVRWIGLDRPRSWNATTDNETAEGRDDAERSCPDRHPGSSTPWHSTLHKVTKCPSDKFNFR